MRATFSEARSIDEIVGGMPTYPLTVPFLLFFFDEFDTAAFNGLAPEHS